jgi:hypothetical protein
MLRGPNRSARTRPSPFSMASSASMSQPGLPAKATSAAALR